jgi:flagella basal body P-ring formation protein FlgA
MSRRRAFLLLVLAAPPALAGAPRASIELLAQARVPAGTVVLGQVAHLRSDDLDLMRTLVHLPVGRAPRAGEAAVLQKDALAAWIRRQAGLAPALLEWRGAGEAHVLRAGRVLAGEEIAGAAVQALRGWLDDRGTHADVQLRVVPRDLKVPEGEVRLQPRLPQAAVARTHMVVWVDVWSAGNHLRALPVRLELSGLPPGGAAALAGRQDDRAPAGAEDAPLAIARGEWATLRSTAGAVTLESRVEVLQDARPGQRVRVRQQGATGPVFARVLGAGQLELVP